jgi:hypothetical protein
MLVLSGSEGSQTGLRFSASVLVPVLVPVRARGQLSRASLLWVLVLVRLRVLVPVPLSRQLPRGTA